MLRLLPFALAMLVVSGCEIAGMLVDAVEPEPPSEPWHEMLDAVNAFRAEGRDCGDAWYSPVPPLTWSGRLETAARRHSHDMAQQGILTHEGSDGSRVGERVTRTGYDWRSVGENIARAQLSVDQVMVAWIESPSHCHAVMDPGYTQMGAAEENRFWTQVFARPRS